MGAAVELEPTTAGNDDDFYELMTVAELKQTCRDAAIGGYSKLVKASGVVRCFFDHARPVGGVMCSTVGSR